jgi:branched-chain amino acid transport system permease protein
LVFDKLFTSLAPILATKIGPLSMTLALSLAMIVSMALTAASAVVIDRLVFRRIRQRGDMLSMVFASFGVALILRNVIGLIFGLGTTLYSKDIAFAVIISLDPLLMVRPDQIAVLGVALVLMLVLHLVLSRTIFGYALRAVAENASLAQVNGINLGRIVVAVWLIGGALAAAAGVFYGLTNQITPVIGRDLLMPVFAAAIVGGIGSVYGAAMGGFLVGLAANLALVILPSGYSPSVPFLIILVVLILRPNGMFGEARP